MALTSFAGGVCSWIARCIRPAPAATHVASGTVTPTVKKWVPAHRAIVPEHGPNVPACFFTLLPLPVIAADDYGRVPVDEVYTVAIHCSRS